LNILFGTGWCDRSAARFVGYGGAPYQDRSPHAPAGITWGGRGPGPERPVTPPRIYLHGGAPGLVGRVDRPGCLSPCAGSRHSGRVHGATGEASFGRLRGYLHLPLPVCLQVATIANCKLQSSVPRQSTRGRNFCSRLAAAIGVGEQQGHRMNSTVDMSRTQTLFSTLS